MAGRKEISRRGFLKLGAAAAAGLALRRSRLAIPQQGFPTADLLGRVAIPGKVEVKVRPDINSATVLTLYEDAVVPWLRERAAPNSKPLFVNQRWVETDTGFIWASDLQPVRNLPNVPLSVLPESAIGPGMWIEVTVPWVDIVLDNPPARSPWLKEAISPRLYYSQILWVDQIKTDEQGQVWYRVNEKFGYGDLMWARGEAFRSVMPEEMTPISPDVEDKRVVVDVTRQTLACMEAGAEVYFCTVSTGAKFNSAGEVVAKWATPLGAQQIWRKTVSMHMSGGTTGGGYDLPGIGWSTFFNGIGTAIHATFWHNDFGTPRSHGCVNARPEDAKWVFRWTLPLVEPIPGDVTVSMPGGTIVEVVES
jgi:hypothetical protein